MRSDNTFPNHHDILRLGTCVSAIFRTKIPSMALHCRVYTTDVQFLVEQCHIRNHQHRIQTGFKGGQYFVKLEKPWFNDCNIISKFILPYICIYNSKYHPISRNPEPALEHVKHRKPYWLHIVLKMYANSYFYRGSEHGSLNTYLSFASDLLCASQP